MRAELATAYEQCRRITREGAKNFYYAFITLPGKKRNAIYASYAFCRLCDDIADEPLSLQEKTERLSQVRQQLHDSYTSQPQTPVFQALKHAVDAFNIPKEHFDEVVRGVEMDLTQQRYTTFEEVRTYCYRVASAVGLICIEIFGYKDPLARQYAIDLGLAMQLVNILRDMKEDAERDRIYLPSEEMERFGYTQEELFQGVINDNFRALMRFQAARAREYFQSGRNLPSLLPRRSRACPAVLHGLYSRLLDRIESHNFNVFDGRIRLSTPEKLLLTTRLWTLSLMLPATARVV